VWTRVTTEVSDASLVVAVGRCDRDAFAVLAEVVALAALGATLVNRRELHST
jgi:hypothetical protein